MCMLWWIKKKQKKNKAVQLVTTQVDDHVQMRLTSQLINSTILSTSFLLPLEGVFSVIFILDLNNSESVKLSFDLSL